MEDFNICIEIIKQLISLITLSRSILKQVREYRKSKQEKHTKL